jgi:hypothetical protein
VTQIHAGLRADSRKAPVRPSPANPGGNAALCYVIASTTNGRLWDERHGIGTYPQMTAELQRARELSGDDSWDIYALTTPTERPSDERP